MTTFSDSDLESLERLARGETIDPAAFQSVLSNSEALRELSRLIQVSGLFEPPDESAETDVERASSMPVTFDELSLFAEGRLEEGDQKRAVTDVTMTAYFRTGIVPFDQLLGGKGFKRGSCILVKGEPGTGKTSLALQVARQFLKDDQQRYVVFVSIEEAAEIALSHIVQSLWRKESVAEFLGEAADQWRNRDDFLEKLQAKLKEQSSANVLDDQTLELVFREIWNDVELSTDRATRQEDVLYVVDSLNALLYRASSVAQRWDHRAILLAVLGSFNQWRRNSATRPTVIFTVEAESRVPIEAAESYVADVVVQLQKEFRDYQAPVEPGKTAPWREELLFCRALKGRGLPTKRMPCNYEFVTGEGLKFFPTYAAQGLISLFHENESQREVIETLRNVDIPSAFPGVIVQEFTRSGLQRLFSARRHADRIPPRHPLIVASVDEYWVDVLRRLDLLYAIPPKRLRLFSLSETESCGDLGSGQVIAALVRKQRARDVPMYRDDVKSGGGFLAVPYMGNIGMLVYRKQYVKQPPQTWEEVRRLCLKRARKGKPFSKLFFETLTYDSLLISCLELGWSNGSVWRSVAQVTEGPNGEQQETLRIRMDEENFKLFVGALKQLFRWVHKDRIVPLRSSVDPAYQTGDDWLFARHWYSTWVDVLTRKDKAGRCMRAAAERGEFGVAPIPVFADYLDRQKKQAASQGKRLDEWFPEHHPGWGEWYLVIQKGSENIDLGIELINNLMTARKVSERARSGAALPLFKQFYTDAGDEICYGTDRSFNDIRRMFAHAKSRTEFYDYRRVARVLSGALYSIISNPHATNVEELVYRALTQLDDQFSIPRLDQKYGRGRSQRRM